MYDHWPTEHETITMLPDAGHTAKKDRDEKELIGDRDHCRPCRAKGVGDHASGFPTIPFYHMPDSVLI